MGVYVVYNTELYHHGVNGQKWGVENGPPYPLDSGGRAALRAQRKAARKEKQEEKKALRSYNTDKKVKDMTDSELKARIDRYNMEKQYQDTLNQTRKKSEAYVTKLLKDAAGEALKRTVTSGLTKLGEKFINDTLFNDNTKTEIFTDKKKLDALSDKDLKKIEDRVKTMRTINSYNKDMGALSKITVKADNASTTVKINNKIKVTNTGDKKVNQNKSETYKFQGKIVQPTKTSSTNKESTKTSDKKEEEKKYSFKGKLV